MAYTGESVNCASHSTFRLFLWMRMASLSNSSFCLSVFLSTTEVETSAKFLSEIELVFRDPFIVHTRAN